MEIKTRTKSASIAVSRRSFWTRVAVAMLAIVSVVLSLMADDGSGTTSAEAATAIRPFHINIPDEALVDLRRRIAATSWPDKETVTDASQGVQLATMQALARYWATNYDWRKCEAKLNALPMFVTRIDGLDIQFIWVRSKNPNALPMILTHGWPGSILEFVKIIGPLTDPTAYGGRAEDAFDVVIPSMPGYGFSGKPTSTGWDAAHIARAWTVLMKRLGYMKFVAQGGDWGDAVADHGQVGPIMRADGTDSEGALAQFAQAGIRTDPLGARLQKEGAESFVKSWNELLGVIQSKGEKLQQAA
jgi:hypothetical protein